jgi:hypothetical protein
MMAIVDDFFGKNCSRFQSVKNYNFAVIAFPMAACSSVFYWVHYVFYPDAIPKGIESLSTM